MTRIQQLEAELELVKEELREERSKSAHLKLQAQCWAMEARCHRSIVYECYAAVGASGRGSWNGALPVREAFGGVI